MMSYTEQMLKNESEKWLTQLSLAQAFVAHVGQPKDVDNLRCHELTRAVRICLSMLGYYADLKDGKYGAVEHSWILLGAGVILDVYAVARLPQVQLVDCRHLTKDREQYTPGPERDDVDWEFVHQLVSEMMRGRQ